MSNAQVSSNRDEPALARSVLPSRCLVFFSIAIVGCTLDLLTKHWVFQWRGLPHPNNEWWIIEGVFGIEPALNRGALFGMGAGNRILFAVFSVVALIGVLLWLFYFKAARDRFFTITLACVSGGILGNLYDRLALYNYPGLPEEWKGSVRDWILFRVQDFTWPNFNIADSLIVCGACMLLWHGFFCSPEADSKKRPVKTAKSNS